MAYQVSIQRGMIVRPVQTNPSDAVDGEGTLPSRTLHHNAPLATSHERNHRIRPTGVT